MTELLERPHAALTIADASEAALADDELEALLKFVYVDGGFTAPEVAVTLFAASAVRQRGRLLFAREPATQALLGMIIVVPPSSSARRYPDADKAEMHLLAVAPERRKAGVGRELVRAALAVARADGYRTMVLWTQPTMNAAQRLYESEGFVRALEHDFERGGRTFMVYERAL